MAVLFVLSIAGIFHRALHLHSSKHKWGFYRENSTTTAANLFLVNGQYNSVQPIASNRAERCNYALLTTKYGTRQEWSFLSLISSISLITIVSDLYHKTKKVRILF